MERPSKGMVHSTEKIEDIMVLEKTGDNEYIVRTQRGIVCKAIFNWFVNVYYVDDIYEIIENKK
jgi:hypothetical protein